MAKFKAIKELVQKAKKETDNPTLDKALELINQEMRLNNERTGVRKKPNKKQTE